MRGIAKLVLVGMLCTVLGCAEKKAAIQTPVERGKYLVMITGCHDCHTPKIEGPGGKPMLDEKHYRDSLSGAWA
jgi:hypothetical protein